jgi:hypothetical protein
MYKLIIYYPKELAQFSYILSGLIDLEKAGLLKYEFSIRSKTKDLGRIDCKEKNYKHDLSSQTKTSFYELIDEKNEIRVKFAFDLNDIGYISTKLIHIIRVDRSFFVRIYNSFKIASKDVKNYKNQPTIKFMLEKHEFNLNN